MNWKLLGTAARVSPDFISGINNSRNSKKARQKLVQKEAQMKQIMDNRQEIFDPMRSISDTSANVLNSGAIITTPDDFDNPNNFTVQYSETIPNIATALGLNEA